MAKKPYTAKQAFTNLTTYKVGQIKLVDGKAYTVTAITRSGTDHTFKVYGIPTSTATDTIRNAEYQRQRESGRLGIYLPGNHILNVNVSR